ncbi:hypothetical protein Emin_1450 [Elusimicrobium minutum Pei191]|uniref:Uncharacterized protein n=1 Tax=Elusimicrobium minutum (strain Pei191) TaxID=445932 RepID=B2KEQ2_ELUMP|nr:hypothetical protein [Elusimicrobium minutum]ACC98998.1 hypothetical protein Emin_1450 [Elusimicrobium minutum Pei191]
MKKIIIPLICLAVCLCACGNKEESLYKKATNLEKAFEYEQAGIEYKKFIYTFPESALLPQIKDSLESVENKQKEINKNISEVEAFNEVGNYDNALRNLEIVSSGSISVNTKKKLATIKADILKNQKENKLGGGYQDAKWGMSKSEVKKVLGYRVKEEGSNWITFNLGNRKELDAVFFNGKLYLARLSPKIETEKEYKGLLLGLVSKFGEGTPQSNMTRSYLHTLEIPVVTIVWEDANTNITWSAWDNTSRDVQNFSYDESFVRDSVMIEYSSKRIEEEKRLSGIQKDGEVLKKEADKVSSYL